jgi:hypothetical protein
MSTGRHIRRVGKTLGKWGLMLGLLGTTAWAALIAIGYLVDGL